MLALAAGAFAAGCTTQVVDFLNPAPGALARYVQFTCCKNDGSGECVDDQLGSATTCQDVGLWKSDASDACQASGTVLTSYTPLGACSAPTDAGAD